MASITPNLVLVASRKLLIDVVALLNLSIVVTGVCAAKTNPGKTHSAIAKSIFFIFPLLNVCCTGVDSDRDHDSTSIGS